MPKAKVNSTPDDSDVSFDSLTPVKIKSAPTPGWYLAVMWALMILGLLWLVTYYLAGESIPFMKDIAVWQNFAIGFGMMVLGLVMTMGWRG